MWWSKDGVVWTANNNINSVSEIFQNVNVRYVKMLMLPISFVKISWVFKEYC